MSFRRGFMRLALIFEHFNRTKRAQKTHSTPTKIIKNLQPKKSAALSKSFSTHLPLAYI